MQRVARTSVTTPEAGRTVLDLLTARFTYRTREQWLALIAEGRVLRNAAVAAPDELLREDDRLEFLPPPILEPPVNTEYRVLFEDEDLIAVDKPPDLPCHPAGRFFNHTLWALIRERTGLESFRFVHRIDRETSGVVLIAKTAMAARGCSRQIEKHQAVKRYLAVVEGTFPEHLSADGWLIRDTASEVRKKRRFVARTGDRVAAPVQEVEPERGSGHTTTPAPRPEWAETELRLVSRHGDISLVEALPRTGRTHQIRATLVSLGFPVVGDTLYGVDDTMFLRFRTGTLTDEDRRRLRLGRQALHAASLVIRHPTTGCELRIEANLPDDMRDLQDRAPGAPASPRA